MKQDYGEIERIARAERMLGEYVGRTFANVIGDIATSCGISIERMLVHVREPGSTGPEPALHFVITEATFDGAHRQQLAALSSE
jgi:hypothetical protein